MKLLTFFLLATSLVGSSLAKVGRLKERRLKKHQCASSQKSIACLSNQNKDGHAICHQWESKHKTLCLQDTGVDSHLAKHPQDSCGCCSEKDEQHRPKYCTVSRAGGDD